jgi:DNA-binding HxlR family transcriptional regulator
VGTYHQYCPIARASEILAERWTPLLIRNLLFGATTFSDLAAGVPTMSRSMLVKRLGELERAGVVQVRPKERGRGCTYELTEAGRDLWGVIMALAEWGDRWLDVVSEHSDPGFALWAWRHVQLDRAALPKQRVVVGFTFPDEAPSNRRYWMLVDHGDAEVCTADPGGPTDLEVIARSRAFVDWHRGARSWADCLRSDDIRVLGPSRLARALPSWHLPVPTFVHGRAEAAAGA